MRAVITVILAGGLLWSLGAAAEGYYLDPPSGRNVIWPPPGGVDAVRPPPPPWTGPGMPANYGDMPPSAYRPIPGRPPTRRAPVPADPGAMRPLRPGRPVEVVPPPSIPIDAVRQPLRDRPQRAWRPVGDDEAKGSAPPPAVMEGRFHGGMQGDALDREEPPAEKAP